MLAPLHLHQPLLTASIYEHYINAKITALANVNNFGL